MKLDTRGKITGTMVCGNFGGYGARKKLCVEERLATPSPKPPRIKSHREGVPISVALVLIQSLFDLALLVLAGPLFYFSKGFGEFSFV